MKTSLWWGRATFINHSSEGKTPSISLSNANALEHTKIFDAMSNVRRITRKHRVRTNRRDCKRISTTLNVYVLEEISKYLYDADHLTCCLTFRIALSYTNFKSIAFFSHNLEKIHRVRGQNVDWLKKCIKNIIKLNDLDENQKNEYSHYQLTNAILATIVDVNDILELADVLNWRVVDYNCLPEDFYPILWEYVDQCSFYKNCTKRQWLLNHAEDFNGIHINCLLDNPMVVLSEELTERYARYIDWSSVNYSHLEMSFIERHRNSIDTIRFNETVEDPKIILKFIDIIDWTIVTAAFGLLEEIYNGGPINVPNPNEALYIALSIHNNYAELCEKWTDMPESLQQYYTRFPTLWLNYLCDEGFW